MANDDALLSLLTIIQRGSTTSAVGVEAHVVGAKEEGVGLRLSAGGSLSSTLTTSSAFISAQTGRLNSTLPLLAMLSEDCNHTFNGVKKFGVSNT